MSRGHGPSLHIEWTPTRVQALDIATGRSAEGATLTDVASITAGHRDALVGIGRGAVFLRSVPLPKAAPDDLRRILSVQVGQIFPLPANQLAFDFHQTPEHTVDGLLTVVGAVRAEDLRQLHSDLRRANLRATRVLPVAFGAPAIALHAGLSEALVISQSPTGLALDLVKGGTVRFSRLAPDGSDILPEARRTLAAAGATDVTMAIAGDLPAPFGAVARPEIPLALLHEAPSTFGFELAEERAREAKRRITIKTRLAGLMMLSAFLLVALLWADRSDALAVVTRGQGAWARELSKLRSIRDAETQRAQRASDIQAAVGRAFGPGQPLSDIAHAVGDSLPPSAWMTGLSLERGKPIEIRGTVTDPNDVARLLENLSNTGRFRDVKLVFANSGKISETPVVQFSVIATAIGNLPLPAPPKIKGHGAARTATKPAGTTGTTTEPKDSAQP
jgi:Tfp pilus assembly protein PilN